MVDRLRQRVLRALRVPPAPEPPLGSAGSTRAFRAAPGFFYRRLIEWSLAQLGAIAGFAFGFGFTLDDFMPQWLQELGGDYLFWIPLVEVASIALFVLQFVVSLSFLRLDYEMRWYIVTDRSLRLREGILRVREQTVSFANIQNVSVKQGPLQRLLKIADVEIRTAGGGDSGSDSGGGDHLHRAVFRGVDNAEEIRDLIRHDLQRLRVEKQLDAEGARQPEVPTLLGAARQFADTAAALRATVAGS